MPASSDVISLEDLGDFGTAMADSIHAELVRKVAALGVTL
jgi:hypothetical protein